MTSNESESVLDSEGHEKQNGGAHEENVQNEESLSGSQTKGGGKGLLAHNTRGRSSSIDVSSEKRKLSPSHTDKWHCDTCKNVFADKKDMVITCEYCGGHRCITCLGMTKTVYKAISGRPDLPWLCNGCIVKSLESIRHTKSIEDRCTDFISEFKKKVDERMEKIEKDVSDIKGDLKSMKDVLVKEIKDTVENVGMRLQESNEETNVGTSIEINSDNIVKQATQEMQSRMERMNNIVIFNMKESDSNLKENIRVNDIQEIKNIVKELKVDIQDSDIQMIKRVGKKGQVKKVHGKDEEVPRLTVAKFTESAKAKIMKSAYKLRFSEDEYYKKIGLKHDMSRDERTTDAKLRREAREKQQAEDDSNLLYLVRGPPWERQIVKVKKNVRKEAQA